MGVVGLNTESGTHEFSCLVKVLSEKISIQSGQRNVYEILRPLLPIHSVTLGTRDIDTTDDYDRMIKMKI